ncbi:MAG: hypothetical protein MUO63_01590 [Desulfobulbaceae bacterium]|nr:hypothetical protein [Desulfobulbaceae bacterium]
MSKNRLLITLFFLFASAGVASASTISQLDSNYGCTIYFSDSQNGIGQTFIATAQSYDSIGVFLYSPKSYSDPDTSISFSLFEGTFTQPIHTWANVDLSTLLQNDGLLNIDISNFTFTSGSIYSFALFNDTNQWFVRYMQATDHYTDGAMYLGYDDSFYPSNSSCDLKFEITAHPIPLPASLALFSAGLFALIPTLIKKFKQN